MKKCVKVTLEFVDDQNGAVTQLISNSEEIANRFWPQIAGKIVVGQEGEDSMRYCTFHEEVAVDA